MFIRKFMAGAIGTLISGLSTMTFAFPVGTFNCVNSGGGYNVKHSVKITEVTVGETTLPLVEYSKILNGKTELTYKGFGAITTSYTIYPIEITIPTPATNFATTFNFDNNQKLKLVYATDCE